MRRWVLLIAAVVAAATLPAAAGQAALLPAASTPAARVAPFDPLLQQVVRDAAPGDTIVAIANAAAPLSGAELAALRTTGATVMGYPHLPMAALIATPAQLDRVARIPSVRSLYWNEPQQYDTAESSALIGAPAAWDLGYNGKGVGVAILDSGVDGRHPDLADHMVANVKILGPEYLQQKHGDFDDILLEDVPTSDTTSGHGTHVAGDAAGDGTASGGKFRGPAYEADIIGIGTGEGLNIFTGLAGFEYVIAHQAEHNIRVVNNSWGVGFRLHDPNHPIVRASKAATEQGIAVVFSAGNRYEEMTLSSYAAPWNITVAAGAKAGGLTGFSSKGLEFDNLPPMSADDPAARDFVGTNPPVDGVGRYHPTVTGIGDTVHSARAAATVVSALGAASGDDQLSPTELPYYTTASGTSMSAPQVAGVVALAQQAFHQADTAARWLAPAQVKSLLQLAAAPMPGLKFFQQGYGLISAPRAVELAQQLANQTATDIDASLANGVASRNAQVATQTEYAIVNSYAWRRDTMDSAGNLSQYAMPMQVPVGADRVKALVSFPTTTQYNVASVDLYLFDASTPRREIGRATAASASHGVQRIDVKLDTLAIPPTFGTWTLEARGDVSSNCFTGTVPRCVKDGPTETWIAAQVLDAAAAGPVFRPTGSTTLFLHNESAGQAPPPALVKPGYAWDGDLVGGTLSAGAPDHPRAGYAGYAHTYAPGTGRPAAFLSDPLTAPVTVGQQVGLDVFLQSETGVVGRGSIGFWLSEVKANGDRRVVFSEELVTPFDSGPNPVANHKVFTLPLPSTVAAGSRLLVELKFSAATHAGMRFYYDAPDEPAAVVLTTGVIE